MASITTPPGCVGSFKPQFVVVIKFFVARARWWDPLRYMWRHLNVRCCRPAWFLEPSFLWAVQCIHCSVAAPRLQYLRGLLGLKNINELKHFGWQVAFLHAGCRVKWLLASMLACSPCVAGRHVELYDGQAAPITIYGISYDNYYGAYLIMALIFIVGVLAGIAGLKIWQHFFVVEVVKIAVSYTHLTLPTKRIV